MRAQPDELAMWIPTKAAFLALSDTLSARQQIKLHATLVALAKNRAEKNDLRSASFLWDLAGYEPAAEEAPKGPRLVIDNTKP